MARSSWLSATLSTSLVNTSVAAKSGSSANESRGIDQSATAHTAAMAVVTSRCPKRNAAQTINGTMRKLGAMPPLSTKCAATSSTSAKNAASSSRRGGHSCVPGEDQPSRSGANTSTPQASPCHQVDQLPASSSSGMP